MITFREYQLFITSTLIATFIQTSENPISKAIAQSAVEIALDQPKIQLRGYVEDEDFGFELASNHLSDVDAEHYENEFIFKNASNYVFKEGLKKVMFACEASYPVTWRMPLPENFDGLTHNYDFCFKIITRINSSFSGIVTEPRNNKYYAYLLIETQRKSGTFPTGHLSCHDVKNIRNEKTIYVWDQGGDVINMISQTTHVISHPKAPFLVIPCRPNQPDVILSLQSKYSSFANNETDVWHAISLKNDYVKFDPKIGFTIDKSFMGADGVAGSYRCLRLETPEYKYVEVTVGSEPSYEFREKMDVKRAANFTRKDLLILCCANGTVEGNFVDCNNEAECDFWKTSFIRDKTMYQHQSDGAETCFSTEIGRFELGKLFMCKGKDVDIIGEFVSAYKIPEILYKKDNPFYLSDYLETYKKSDNIKVEQKIQFMFQFLSPAHMNISVDHLLNYYEDSRRGYHITYNQDWTPYAPFGEFFFKEVLNEAGLSVTDELARLIPVDHLREEGVMYEGMKLLVTCVINPFFYSDGGWIQVRWRNGNRTVFEERNLVTFEKGDLTLARYFTGSSYIVLGKMTLQIDMESVECLAPVWNRHKWESRQYELAISESILPQFENPEDGTLNVNLGEADITLNCSIVPSHQNKVMQVNLKWDKDGKTLPTFGNTEIGLIFTENMLNSTYSVIQLRNISVENQGTYKCIVENMKGIVAKTFRVSVPDQERLDRKQNLMIVALTVTLCILILCALVVFSYRKSLYRICTNNLFSS